MTHDKTDEKDAVLIARLTAQLRCYEPEPVDETWGRLRHLGARREQLITEISGQIQQMRDLLECVWPAALECAQQPFRSRTWIAALTVIVDRDGGEFDPPDASGWLGSSRRCYARSASVVGRNPADALPEACSQRCLIWPG